MLKTISIYDAAQLLTAEVANVDIPSLAVITEIVGREDSVFDNTLDRYFFQTMRHQGDIVIAVKSGKIRAVDAYSMMPESYHEGMELDQLIRYDDFLAFAASLGFSISYTGTAATPEKAVPKQRFQEQEILRVIGELGYDPKKLPKDTPNKGGVKAEVRAKLPGFLGSVFNKAWDRLSRSKEIIKLK
jgi:hypothetical protein